MKIIYKIKIHPFFYLFAIICMLNGLFKDFIYIMFIISIHELGHIIISQTVKWKIKKIVVLPFGGITIFECPVNTPIKEEFLVAIAGITFQSFLFFIREPKFLFYNWFLLLFNLLPIIPLDGSKLLQLFFNKICSFYRSLSIVNIVSILTILGLIIFSHNLMEYFVIILLCFKVIETIKKKQYIFHKFLFERYLYRFHFHRQKIIKEKKLKQMKKEYKHLFYIDQKHITEREMLRKVFDK